ncbi:hypothetical protein ACHHYP_09138 [Achlya hypogyna]|uniref:EF-hand domain-containing protein n=1 Tax=Achlya hypogyna TaxID=1202772 RepID=A0A1V9YNL9_ACHHY|nr:hypothetical protein ACHHYP_09138 [Achlya hypogyna]
MLCGKVKYVYHPSSDEVVGLPGGKRDHLCRTDGVSSPVKCLQRGIYNPLVGRLCQVATPSPTDCINTRRQHVRRRRPQQNIAEPETNSGIEIRDASSVKDLAWTYHRWLNKHGKESSMKAEREKMVLMRRWFEFLDSDGSGEIGLNELEDPLVSVGLAKCRDDVRKLIRTVDDSEDAEVNFDEFLSMVHGKKKAKERAQYVLSDPKLLPRLGGQRPHTDRGQRPRAACASPMEGSSADDGSRSESEDANSVVKLFTDLQGGKLGDLTLPFPILITAYRRRMLLNAHMSVDAAERCEGQSVLTALETTRREALSEAPPEEKPRPGLVANHVGTLRRHELMHRHSTLRRHSLTIDDIIDDTPKPGLVLPDLVD